MEELEALLVSVKAWASKLLEALGLCRSDCDALKTDNAALKLEAEALKIENANLTADLVVERSKVAMPEPEEKPFDLGPILAVIGEFKVAIEAVSNDLHNGVNSLSASHNELRTSLVKLADEVHSQIGNIVPAIDRLNVSLAEANRRPEPPNLNSFIGTVNDFMNYVRNKLNRLPF